MALNFSNSLCLWSFFLQYLRVHSQSWAYMEERQGLHRGVLLVLDPIRESFHKTQRFSEGFRVPRPSKHYIHRKTLGELIFGSLHKFHVVPSASRSYTWNAGILCGIHGVGPYIEKFGEDTMYGLITSNLCNRALAIT